ncbi:MAG: Ldh family oxidoreductase, partial [Bacteroidota bacterium]
MNQIIGLIEDVMRVAFDEMKTVLERVLEQRGFEPARAALSARLFAEASCDGIYSHGLNRFPRYL